jgi:hypothetical protein
MATFILTINWTDQGIRNVKDAPKRSEAAPCVAPLVVVDPEYGAGAVVIGPEYGAGLVVVGSEYWAGLAVDGLQYRPGLVVLGTQYRPPCSATANGAVSRTAMAPIVAAFAIC